MIEKIAGMETLIEGIGKPLLFLHGYLSNKESFVYQTNFFKKYFKVIAPDLIGFGNSKMDYPFCIDDYTQSVNRLIDELNVEKIDVIAHSFGARILFKMLPTNQKIDKIVLTGAAGIKPKFSLKRNVKIIKYKIAKRFFKNDLSSYGSNDYKMLDAVMKKSFVKIVNEHMNKRLVNIKNESLILFGENDYETPIYMAKKLHKGLENSQFLIMKNAGHFAFIDRPNEFNSIVKEFLL